MTTDDALAKDVPSPRVVGTPVLPAPQPSASVPAGAAEVVAQVAAAVAPGVTVDGRVSETGAVSFSVSRGASPSWRWPRRATAMQVRTTPQPHKALPASYLCSQSGATPPVVSA